MPRRRNHAAPITAAVQDLLRSITRLVEEAAKSIVIGESRAAKGARAAAVSSTSVRIRRAVKATWAKYTPAERAARICKMLAGRGLKPKAGPTRGEASRRRRQARRLASVRKLSASRAARANPWAKLTPEERAARIAKMQAGRRRAAQPPAPVQAGV